MEYIIIVLLWILSQWKIILGVFFIYIILGIIKNDVGNLSKKIKDIDYNVKQIAKKLEVFGNEEDNSKPVHEQTFSKIFREQKRKDLDK